MEPLQFSPATMQALQKHKTKDPSVKLAIETAQEKPEEPLMDAADILCNLATRMNQIWDRKERGWDK